MSNVITNAKDMPVVFYRFTVRGMSAKVKSKELSKKTESDTGAENGTVSTLIERIPSVWAKPLKQIEQKIRNHFEKEAIRLGDCFGVPISIIPKFDHVLNVYKQTFELAYSKLLDASENGELEKTLKAQSGTIIDEIRIPSIDAIRKGYGVEISTFINFESKAVKDAMNVLTTDLKDRLTKEVEATQKLENAKQLDASTEKTVKEVKDFLDTVKEACSVDDIKGVHFKSVIDKARRVIDTLPAYNVTNNPRLNELINAVKEAYNDTAKEVLKASPEARKKAVEKADEIVKGFANMF